MQFKCHNGDCGENYSRFAISIGTVENTWSSANIAGNGTNFAS